MHVLSLLSVQEPHHCYTLHHACRGVPKEFTPWLQRTVYPYMMLWRHKEVARLWRVVRSLFGNVVSFGLVRIVPVTSKCLAEYRVQRLLNTPATWLKFVSKLRNETLKR